MTDEFKGQVNPTKQIHTPPPALPSVNRLTAGQIGAFGTIIVDLILAQVAFALGGVSLLGVKPFAFLTDWGNELVKQASDAYKNSFAVVDVINENPVGTTTTGTLNQVYSAAAAAKTATSLAQTTADGATGSIQTTWNGLWDASKGNTGTPSANKTITDVKAAVGEVRNTGITADGKAQDTIDGVYSAVMGGTYTGMPADYVKPALTGLTYTARNNVATGSNLVIDAAGDNASYWTQTGAARSSNYKHTGSYSVALTSAGATQRTLFFNTIDTGAVQPYFVREAEIYYVECYLYAPSTLGTVRLVAQTNGNSINVIETVSMTTGTWVKLSGQYTIPVGVNVASFGIALLAGETTNGAVVYVDDMLVREITNAQLAQTDVESTWNQIYNGVYNLSLQGRSLTDVFNALYETKHTADGGVSAAGTAQGAADAANGNALTADQLAILASAQNNLVISPFFDDTRVRRINGFSGSVFTAGYVINDATHSLTSSTCYKIAMTGAGSSSNYGGVYLNTLPINGSTNSDLTRWPVVSGEVYKFDILVYCPTSNTSSKGIQLLGNFTTIASKTPIAVSITTARAQTQGSWDNWTGTFTVPTLVNSSTPLTMGLLLGFGNNAVGAAGETMYIGRALIYK